MLQVTKKTESSYYGNILNIPYTTYYIIQTLFLLTSPLSYLTSISFHLTYSFFDNLYKYKLLNLANRAKLYTINFKIQLLYFHEIYQLLRINSLEFFLSYHIFYQTDFMFLIILNYGYRY